MRSLSSVQFGGGIPKPPSPYSTTQFSSGSDLAFNSHESTPLPYKGETRSSSGQAAAWRLRRVLPYGKSTAGSTFTPN